MGENATKTCVTCGTNYADTKQFFVFREGKTQNQCRNCHKQAIIRSRQKKAQKRERELNKVESKGLDIYAALAATGGSNIPHTAEVVEQVITYFGGVSGFSAMLVKQFYDSQPGSSVRNKLLETICRLVQSNVDVGGAKKPLDLWTEEELEDELNARFAAIQRGVTINVEAAPAQALAAPDPADTESDDSREERDSSIDCGIEGTEERGSETLPADGTAAEDT
jgi:hypothetical protein